MRIGLLHTQIREEEEAIINEAHKSGVDIDMIDVQVQILIRKKIPVDCDIYLGRCINGTLGLNAVRYFESLGKEVVASHEVMLVCGNKFYTSLALEEHGVPVVPYVMVFGEEQAHRAVEMLGGYPVVLKPVGGAWGRLVSKVNDRDALEALIGHKLFSSAPINHALYMQPFIKKPGRDIRVTVLGDEVLCAIYRENEHWVTNTARGARARLCAVDNDLKDISIRAARSLGGGILGIDIFETPEGYCVNEVNFNPEFKNVQRVTGVNVAHAIVTYLVKRVNA
jgi:[lysine-biosynthesis-protein LysW]---L-2-aminoadipate ligase